MLQAATGSGVPVRLSTKYWAEDLGRPYQPAETFAGYSYHNFLERPKSSEAPAPLREELADWTRVGEPTHAATQTPRPYSFYWELWGLGSHRLLRWGDPDYVRRATGTFTLSGSIGFEIDPPLAQKGFGNQPGKWTLPSPGKYEFERYWMFYTLWGRLSYDPKTSDRIWMHELETRFGKAAAPHVMEAYRNASGVLNEIVAVHLADPNMYIWPEINPGGLIDSYREVLPSDPRFIASIPEAVNNRLNHIASAKQTPVQTATELHRMSLRTEQEVELAGKTIPAENQEWKSTQTDLRILALLARYHGRKQLAADQLEAYYRDPRDGPLFTAQRELRGAAAVWEQLGKLTADAYPPHMAVGPQDTGHWADKLAWVKHDQKTLDERIAIFEQFGRFLFGFDFGPRINPFGGPDYKRTPYLWTNRVEPRFTAVDEASLFDEAKGFGWATAGERTPNGPPPASYRDIRAAEEKPEALPENALYSGNIAGRGAQTFRVRTGPGEFEIKLIKPDRTVLTSKLTANNGYVDVVFPEGDWAFSGLVISAPSTEELPPPFWPLSLPRPVFKHVPVKTAPPDKSISLTLTIPPQSAATTVRLHYRAVNQLAKFKTMEAPANKAVFTIPAEDVKEQWDLMYYFEVLNSELSGWFEPDPKTTTPYYVVSIVKPPAEEKDPDDHTAKPSTNKPAAPGKGR